MVYSLTLLHSERLKLFTILAVLSAIGLRKEFTIRGADSSLSEFMFIEKGGNHENS